jgi:hypothetical protein
MSVEVDVNLCFHTMETVNRQAAQMTSGRLFAYTNSRVRLMAHFFALARTTVDSLRGDHRACSELCPKPSIQVQ